MSTKETLPPELIQHECYKAITCLHIAVSELGNTEQRIITIAQALEANAEIREIDSLRTRLEAAEKELAEAKEGSKRDWATLTIEQIKDLAKFAGYEVGENVTDQEIDTEITIETCPDKGVKDDDGATKHYRHIAYLDEYPEEGVYPLGQAIDAAIAKGTE